MKSRPILIDILTIIIALGLMAFSVIGLIFCDHENYPGECGQSVAMFDAGPALSILLVLIFQTREFKVDPSKPETSNRRLVFSMIALVIALAPFIYYKISSVFRRNENSMSEQIPIIPRPSLEIQ